MMTLKQRFLSFFGFFSLFVWGIFSVFSALPTSADGVLPEQWRKPIEKIEGLQTPQNGNSVEMVNNFFRKNIVPILKYVFIGVGLIFFGLYAYKMAIGMGDDDQLEEQKKNLIFAALGFVIMSGAAKLSEIMDPARSNAGDGLADFSKAEGAIQMAMNIMQMALAPISIALLFYGGFLWMTSGGDEEKSANAKNFFKFGFLGFVVVMLAEPLVRTVFYPNYGQDGVGTQQATNFIVQAVGVLKFVLTFLAVFVFVAFIYAGFLWLTARDDDDQAEKAKKMLLWTAIGIVVILISYSLAIFFVPGVG